MKKGYSLLLAISSLLLVSCSNDSVTEEFNDANEINAKKLIERIDFTSSQFEVGDFTFTVDYNANNKVIGASNGIDYAQLIHEDDKLTSVTNGSNPFSIDQLYQTPFEIFETGNVLDYDERGNPILISILHEESDPSHGGDIMITRELFATITYDSAPNPYFFTFDAAGLIEILDDVQTIFNLLHRNSKVEQARALFPLNNIKSIVYTDEEGKRVGELNIDYIYDSENYPSYATFNITSENNITTTHTAAYFYKQ